VLSNAIMRPRGFLEPAVSRSEPVTAGKDRPLLLLLALLLAIPADLMGCDCASVPVCLRASKASAIFVGMLLRNESNGDGQIRNRLLLTVEELFKGLRTGTKEAEVSVERQANCDLELVDGRRYLVFAVQSSSALLASRDCPVPIPIRQAAMDVRWLRAWVQGSTPSEIIGQVRTTAGGLLLNNFEGQPLWETELIASGEGGVYRAMTDSQGGFTIRGLMPGKYDLRAIRFGYQSVRSSYPVNVPRGGCARVSLSMFSSSSISGKISNPDGQPVQGVKVELALMEDGGMQLAKETTSNEEGRYEFNRIPVGDYVLGVNLFQGLNSRLPYPARYFPGVASRELATVLRIDEGQNLSPYDFSLEGPQRTRTIRVKVKWPDGRPVTNASVEFQAEAEKESVFRLDWQSRYTDEKGEVRCEVLSAKEFTVRVDRLFWIRSSFAVEDRQDSRVPPGESPVDLELVVSSRNDFSAQETPTNMARFND
jgi:hypothetical protein